MHAKIKSADNTCSKVNTDPNNKPTKQQAIGRTGQQKTGFKTINIKYDMYYRRNVLLSHDDVYLPHLFPVYAFSNVFSLHQLSSVLYPSLKCHSFIWLIFSLPMPF